MYTHIPSNRIHSMGNVQPTHIATHNTHREGIMV